MVWDDELIPGVVPDEENEMLKLNKLTNSTWRGTGFGVCNATWVIKGAEHIEVCGSYGNWTAFDNGARFANAFTRSELLDLIAYKRPELAEAC